MKSPLCAVLTAAMLLACSARKAPSVGTSEIEHFRPPPEESRTGRRPALIIPPGPLEQPLPEYPETAVAGEVACVARILYHVETTGEARLVRLEWDEAPPQAHVAVFEDAVRTALSRWSFTPAVRIVPKRMEDGSIEPRRTPVPNAQHALIRFRVEDGKAIVE